jgi:hypothetical protein
VSWQVVDHITIYREEGMYAGFPNLVRTPCGDLLVLFRRSPYLGYSHHGHPLFDMHACRSTDEGQTWDPPQFVTRDPLGGIVDTGTHTLPDGSIFLHAAPNRLMPKEDSSHVSEWVGGAGEPFWVRSRDDGRTWTAPRRFPPLPDTEAWETLATDHDAHAGVCRSGLLSLPDGRLLLPGKAPSLNPRGWPYYGMCWFSSDMGETWAYGGLICEDPVAHFTEPAIHLTPSGRILILFRCHPKRATAYEAAYSAFLARVYSDDGGESWSGWEETTMRGCPGHLLGLRDGRIFATVGRRLQEESGCVARVLDPEGSDLDTAPDLVIRADSTTGRKLEGGIEKPLEDCGYPWAVELEDGKVLVVYYYTYPDGLCGVEGTVVEER